MANSVELAETVAQAGHWVVKTYDAVWADGVMICDPSTETQVCMTCYGVTGLAGPCRSVEVQERQVEEAQAVEGLPFGVTFPTRRSDAQEW